MLPRSLSSLQSWVTAMRSFNRHCVTLSRGPSGTSAWSGQLSRLVKGTSTYRWNGKHSSESVHLSVFQESAANRSKDHAQLLLLRRGLVRLGRGCQCQAPSAGRVHVIPTSEQHSDWLVFQHSTLIFMLNAERTMSNSVDPENG